MMLDIINKDSSPISQNLSDIIAIARNKPRLKSEVMARVGDFAGHFSFGMISGTIKAMITPPNIQVANIGRVKFI